MIEYLVLILILFYFLIASIEDIKKREVYDYINYSLTFFIIIIAIFDSIITNSIGPIKYVGFGLLIGFTLGSILYYLGIWGGGDAKFLIGFSAATYYLINFSQPNTIYEMIYFQIINNTKIFFELFIQDFLFAVTILDLIFLIGIIISIIIAIKDRNRKRIKNLILLLTILTLLYIGIELNYSNINLIIIGFISFLLIFFADDELFNQVYFKFKKYLFELKENDILDKNEKYKENKKNIISKENLIFGIDREDIYKLKENFPKNKTFQIRKIIPYSILIGLNFLIYVIKIITIEHTNLQILFFMLKFLFLSFLSGGIITIFILIYLTIKNYKKIKINSSRTTKIIIYTSFIIITLISIINIKFLILYFLILIYYIYKIGKELERIGFVKNKKIKDIVPGDWIVEDVIVNNKLIYSAEEFKLGINDIQLENIKKLSKQNTNFNHLYVKDGIAFLPPLFIGFLIMILIL